MAEVMSALCELLHRTDKKFLTDHGTPIQRSVRATLSVNGDLQLEMMAGSTTSRSHHVHACTFKPNARLAETSIFSSATLANRLLKKWSSGVR